MLFLIPSFGPTCMSRPDKVKYLFGKSLGAFPGMALLHGQRMYNVEDSKGVTSDRLVRSMITG